MTVSDPRRTMMSDGQPISELGELDLVRRIRALGVARAEGVIRGIGDDAAVFRIGSGRVAVVTTDLLIEGVHFRSSRSEPRALGAKALAVNLSDIAAMGARPRECFLGIAAPGSMTAAYLESMVAGLADLGREYQVNLLGGDTSSSPGPLVLSVTVVGDGDEGRLLYRSGARPGDVVVVTGAIGDSAGGLTILERGLEVNSAARRALRAAHESPRPHVAEGPWLAACGAATAMMDVSDGIATDLGHLLTESGGLGATLERALLPLSPELSEVAAEVGLDKFALALGGGEDYVLLATLQQHAAEATQQAFARQFGRPLHPVGIIEAVPGLRLRTATGIEVLERRGFEHWSR